MNPQRVQLLRDRDLLLAAEDHGGLLLAVAQRDVVDLQIRTEGVLLLNFRQIRPRAAEPLVGFPRLLHISTPEIGPAEAEHYATLARSVRFQADRETGDVTI